MDELKNALINVLLVMLVVAVPYVVAEARGWLKSKEPRKDALWLLMLDIGKMAVMAAEQLFAGPGLGAEKKAYARDVLIKAYKFYGITVQPVIVEALIEGLVKSLYNLTQPEKRSG